MKIQEIISAIYGSKNASEYASRITGKIKAFKQKKINKSPAKLDEKTSLLITYADMVGKTQQDSPLQTLKMFLDEYAFNIISAVHILPFFPFSSDAGFSVIDYRQVNPDFGDWKDIKAFEENFTLAFDAVFNHISKGSLWFKGFLSNDDKYKEWFIEPTNTFDSSQVFRPRALPLFHNYRDSNGKIHQIWTTFSEDQVDLNFKSPELLLEMIDILLFYLEQGARIIRLDAIAFCWKKSGTRCLHEPQAHLLVKLLRAIADKARPGTVILTETNVPHQENISYFGNGDEAQMVYQFPLPPLVAQAILRQDAKILTNWAANLEPASAGCTFLNFLASHDGVGVRPLVGIAPDSELFFLANECLRKGGKVGYKNNPDGSQSPYELNINYYSLLAEPDEPLELSVRKFIMSQAIMLTMPGVPGIYFHSLFGSENWTEGLPPASENRTINREKIPVKILREELNTPGSRRQLVYSQYRKLLEIRSQQPAFHPDSGFEILNISPQVFAIRRGTKSKQPLLGLFNVSSRKLELPVTSMMLSGQLRSVINDEIIAVDKINLLPFGFKWLVPKKR
jgi:sucrose phosphorylase